MTEMKWIPVSERLPDHGIDVLIQSDTGLMDIASYTIEHDWLSSDANYLSDEVIAWMPLPEPYGKGETE